MITLASWRNITKNVLSAQFVLHSATARWRWFAAAFGIT
jgi:hypothetical protein